MVDQYTISIAQKIGCPWIGNLLLGSREAHIFILTAQGQPSSLQNHSMPSRQPPDPQNHRQTQRTNGADHLPVSQWPSLQAQKRSGGVGVHTQKRSRLQSNQVPCALRELPAPVVFRLCLCRPPPPKGSASQKFRKSPKQVVRKAQARRRSAYLCVYLPDRLS